jgi:hypothetical protein
VIVNVVLANQPPERVKKLYDLLRPIECGLIEAGHRVIGYGLGLLPAPAVNLLVEFFADDAFVDELLRLKSEAGARMVVGLVSAEDVEDDEAMEAGRYPRRRFNLERVLAQMDFVWTLLPQVPFYETVCGAGNAAVVEFGFSERLLSRHVIARPELRDLDVVIDGDATVHRRDIIEALKQRGFKCHVSGAAPLPSFATADLARRAKIFLDARRSPSSRFSSVRRICKGLHNGTLVVTERSHEPQGALDRFAVGCDPERTVEHCAAAIRSGLTVDLGVAALGKFRAETSMRQGLQAGLRLPVFQRLGH